MNIVRILPQKSSWQSYKLRLVHQIQSKKQLNLPSYRVNSNYDKNKRRKSINHTSYKIHILLFKIVNSVFNWEGSLFISLAYCLFSSPPWWYLLDKPPRITLKIKRAGKTQHCAEWVREVNKRYIHYFMLIVHCTDTQSKLSVPFSLAYDRMNTEFLRWYHQLY